MELAKIFNNQEPGKIYGLIGNYDFMTNTSNYSIVLEYRFKGQVKDYLKNPKMEQALKMVMLDSTYLDKTIDDLSPTELKIISLAKALIENKKYIFDLETISQFAYLLHIGELGFKSYGAGKKYNGTYILSISGDIINPNLYEFEMYTPFKNIIKSAGGIEKEYSIKCVFTNGFLNPPIDFNAFQKMTLDYECFDSFNMKIGNGGVCFIKEDRCMVRVILKIIKFADTLSCGKCTPCRSGFDLCEYYINKMLLGHSVLSDYSSLKDCAEMIKIGASCLYIKSLADCILSSMEMFKEEFIYLIENKTTLYSFVKD